MPSFGKTSQINLSTCHQDIVSILSELIKYYDFSVTCGLRTPKEQQELFAQGRSKLDGVDKKSKHQGKVIEGRLVSMAADIVPYKKGTNAFEDNEKERARFYVMMGMVKAISARLLEEGKISHKVRFGMDWDGDDTYRDQDFDDLPHLELIATQ